MTMSCGCWTNAERDFCERWEVRITKDGIERHIRGGWFNNAPAVSEMHGDCTAATLFFAHTQKNVLAKQLRMMQEYLSLNGRISAFFTLHVATADVQEIIKLLEPFAIQGLHVQYSNRHAGKNAYQLTGILSVPNPAVQYSYHHWETDPHKEHDVSIDGRDNVAINKQLGLSFNLGK